MSTTITKRQPAGIPVGGQFASHDRAEATLSLLPAGIPSEDDWLRSNDLHLPAHAQAEFETRLALLGRPATLFDRVEVFDAVHREFLGYAPRDLAELDAALDTLTAAGQHEQAAGVRRLIDGLLNRQAELLDMPPRAASAPAPVATVEHEVVEAQNMSFDEDVADKQRVAMAARLPADHPANLAGLDVATPGVDIADARIREGQLFDSIVSVAADGRPLRFERRRNNVFPDAPGHVRIQVDRKLNVQDMETLTASTGYALNSVRRDAAEMPYWDTDFSVIIPINQKADPEGIRYDVFERKLSDLLVDGSDVRMTDRSGPGTRGTRAIDPMAAPPRFAVFYDQVARA